MSLKTKTHIINFTILLHWHMHTHTKADGGMFQVTLIQGKVAELADD